MSTPLDRIFPTTSKGTLGVPVPTPTLPLFELTTKTVSPTVIESETRTVPATCNESLGDDVPMPTLPLARYTSLAVIVQSVSASDPVDVSDTHAPPFRPSKSDPDHRIAPSAADAAAFVSI
ncbi:MAG: hypothetical protein A3G34_16185 [Candidatus Lindowbacteria bacterium RIFCSPLOWO2_12_FULL_62_27]|nr:MAG: hypothetical protein A3I06_17005 [Candidatus Lindowbacteria bacterium RIFCSPLOWO2_02_FULL_62_12]OGH59890.1 MAG: hypothetical protein A3G34_16185 [Candidatus Lindowbacteria bacterium RIFCSPLOWO2_12_FULL_62_27]